jgi:transcriptional regulator with XRE-family HTH domain
MTEVSTLENRRMCDADFRKEYEAPEDEFVAARKQAGLSQTEVAQRMDTTQSAVARLESGGKLPGLRTLARYAEATNSRAEFRLRPQQG